MFDEAVTKDVPEAKPPLLAVRGASKRYGVVQALNNVSLEARVGEVVGLIGENGAGKSTLLGITSGTVVPDDGTVELSGKRLTMHTYADAARNGIFRIYQHQALVSNLSVAENIFLGQERKFVRGGSWLSRRAMVRRARRMFDSLGLEDIDPAAPLGKYSFAERQVIEIVRSLAQADLLEIEHPVILLDEPTSALSREQVDFFFAFVRSIRHRAAQVFVSHRLEELLALSDRVYVLKDGVTVAELDDVDSLSKTQLHALMVGRVPEDVLYNETDQLGSDGPEVLTVDSLTQADNFTDVSFSLHQGEVLGIAGVVGSGKSSLGRALFEAGRGTTGTLTLNGRQMRRGGPREAIRSRMGYIPPERHAEGIVEQLSVSHNLSLPRVGSLGRNPFIDLKAERASAQVQIRQLRIKTPTGKTLIGDLSGGNQQKVIFGRWTAVGSRVMILDNPTNGIDVGAKAEIYKLIRKLSADGVSIILISDDLPELIGLSDRIAVMRDGRLAQILQTPPAKKPSEAELVAHMV
ncbi:sugar ABC transporter ATP-binding protein [Sinomonas soli]